MMNSTILAIETSCDETAFAIMRGRHLLASEVASQVAEHQPYGGVVPEVASRNHLLHAPRLLDRVLQHSGISLDEIDAFAATTGPGLASSLMIGASLAKGLALGLDKPYLAVNHLEGHLLSPFFGSDNAVEANISLIVSGGHTFIVDVQGLGDYRIVGRTVDDAAGEAFDKVAKMLGLGYPGGPEIEQNARGGNSARFDLPRSMLYSGDFDFSFSGLKTAVRYLLPKLSIWRAGEEASGVADDLVRNDRLSSSADQLSAPASVKVDESAAPLESQSRNLATHDGNDLADICASFQRAVTDVLVAKTIAAARSTNRDRVTVSGGVSCNQELRKQMSVGCESAGLELDFAPTWLSTDNAAMIAFAALLHLEQGDSSPITTEIDPNLALA